MFWPNAECHLLILHKGRSLFDGNFRSVLEPDSGFVTATDILPFQEVHAR